MIVAAFQFTLTMKPSPVSVPFSAAHNALSNIILVIDHCNWPDKNSHTDDEIALHAQTYIEDLTEECEKLQKDEHVHKGEIKTLRSNLKVMHKERDEAEDGLVEHVSSFRKMELLAGLIEKRRACARGNVSKRMDSKRI